MRRMTWYEAGQIVTSFVILLMVGIGFFSSAIWTFGVRLACVAAILLYHVWIMRNWRGIVDEQIGREQDRAMAAGRSYLPGTAQRRRRSLQRGSMLMTIMFGLVFSFLLVVVVLDVGGWLS